jgi:hypothetical protein
MKDIKRLNDLPDDADDHVDCGLLCDGTCKGAEPEDCEDCEAEQDRCARVDGWSKCSTPVLCVFKGQVPSRTVHEVILHNFLSGTILGFIMTEKITDPADLQGMPETAGLCFFCDKPVSCLGPSCPITKANSETDALDDDGDDELDIHFHGPDSVVADMISTCDNCDRGDPDTCDACRKDPEPNDFNSDPCFGCPGPDEVVCTLDTPCLKGGRKDPGPNEFDKLKDEHWNIMCRWSLMAANCHAQRDFQDDLDILCRISGDCCHFSNCPRINNA